MSEKIAEILKYSEGLQRLGAMKKRADYYLIEEATNYLPPNSSVSRRLWHLKNNQSTIPSCKMCSTPVPWDNKNGGFYRTYCSNKCATSDPHRIEKIKQTNMDRYGSTSPMHNPDIKQKQINTIIQKYNTTNVSSLEHVKQQKIQTCLQNHGTEFPQQNHEIKQKRFETNKTKYGSTNYLASDEYREIQDKLELHPTQQRIKQQIELLSNKDWLLTQHHTNQKSIIAISKELEVSQDTVTKYIKYHDIEVKHHFVSTGEHQIADFLRSLDVVVETRTRSIVGKELDIFLPEYNLAIEYNGLYWHSTIHDRIESTYHLHKTELCEQHNIRLLQIFEDEWRDYPDKCKDTIVHLLNKSSNGEYARKTNVREIPWHQAKNFLDQYHLLNSGSSGSYRIGAFNKANELIGVMVFGTPTNEFGDKTKIELKRFVTNKKNNPGLGSKMFKYAVKQKGYNEVYAFVDRRWFTGLVKSHIGFEVIGVTNPTFYWTNGKYRLHRRAFNKPELIRKYQFDYSMTKEQMMNELGFYKIYDCGKLKLRWEE